VNGELADAGETPGKSAAPANVIDGVHIRGIETGDHGIERGLLFLGKRFVGHGDPRVGEGVVVEGRVGVEVVSWRAVAVHAVQPLLLQRDPKTVERPTLFPIMLRRSRMLGPS